MASNSSGNGSSPNVASAVSFLRDPSVRDSPLSKKLAFLEAKGLSPQEIDAAMRMAGNTQQQPQQQYQYAPPYAGQPRQTDWRDWFIMATVGGAVGTLAYSLARRYLFPALQPPSESELQAAQAALTAKYDEAAAILADLQQETSEIKSSLDDQCSKVDASVEQVAAALQAVKDKEEERNEEMKSIREEVDSIKGLMEKMFDKHKDAQSASLGDIQQEVKSLKSLLARRTDGSSTPTSSSTLPNSASSPSLPHSSSYSPYVSPYTSSAGNQSRFGVSSSQTYGGQGSSSLASIANRPPGIPAWQLPPTSSSSAVTPAPLAASTDTPKVNGDSGADAVDSSSTSKGEAKDMAESGEIADPSEASEIPA